MTLWPLLSHWKSLYCIPPCQSIFACLLLISQYTCGLACARWDITSAKKPFASVFFLQLLLHSQSPVSLLVLILSNVLAYFHHSGRGPHAGVYIHAHTHTQLRPVSTMSRVLILALFSRFTFKIGAGFRQSPPRPLRLLPLSLPLLQSFQPERVLSIWAYCAEVANRGHNCMCCLKNVNYNKKKHSMSIYKNNDGFSVQA